MIIGDFKFLLQNTKPGDFSLSNQYFRFLYENLRIFVPKSLTLLDGMLTVSLNNQAEQFDKMRIIIYLVVLIILFVGAILKFSGIISIYSFTTATLNYFLDIRNLHITYLVQRSERFVLNFRAEENDDVWDTLSEGESQIEGSSLDGGSSIASITKRKAGSSAL